MIPLLPVLPTCQHRGESLPGWMYECRSNRVVHRLPGVATMETCGECVLADQPNLAGLPLPVLTTSAAAPDWRSCRHRGPVSRQRKADLCGRRGEMFPVYQCAVHGECVLTRFCEKQPERHCGFCEDAEVAPVSDVAVVITTHNYARFLAQAIDSLLSQTTPPAEIIIIDDASGDDPATVASRYANRGVRFIRIDERNVYRARAHGYAVTTSPFVMFLDADDWLGSTYIERGRAAFTHPAIGIAYTDLIDEPSGEIRHHAAVNMEGQNYIHAGAITRRTAIDQANGLGESGHVLNTRADWFLWRRLMRAGWRAAHYEAAYHYRQHGENIHHNDGRLSYFELASLALETVTIVLPLSGRERFLAPLLDWVSRQAWPSVELLMIDSSEDAEFSRRVRSWLADQTLTATYVLTPGVRGLADADRRQDEHFLAVQKIMPQIYRHLDRVRTEYALVIEEDIAPSADAIDTLMRSFAPDVAAVSGVYRSRWMKEKLLVWTVDGVAYEHPREGVEDVGGSGFGCLMYRRSAFNQAVIHDGGSGNFDPNAGEDLRSLGWRWRVDWGVKCVHDGVAV